MHDQRVEPARQPIDWYFDINSPFAYLQWQTRSRESSLVQLSDLFRSSWARSSLIGDRRVMPRSKSKRLFTYRLCQWRANKIAVPLHFPDRHPFNPLAGLRLIVAAGSSTEAVDLVFNAVFARALDVSEPSIIAELGRALGIEDTLDAIQAPDVKQKLRANTENAIASGVFGVPTAVVDGHCFWGEDSTDMLLDYLSSPSMFERPEMRRLATLPVGATRRR